VISQSDFGLRQTVWKRHAQIPWDGTWDNVLTRLFTKADAAMQPDGAVSIDSTINSTHQHAGTKPRPTGGRCDPPESAFRAC
jgi:hypothetical protein